MEQKQINLLIYMLEDIRKVTLKGVSGLTKEQLFREPASGEFCIGSYLMHLGECDLGWLQTISGEKQPEELKKKAFFSSWFDCKDEDYNPPKEPLGVDEYLDTIAKCREKVIEHIKTLSDSDLDGIVTAQRNYDGEIRTKEYTRKWIIYHLIEHEAHTRGQMFMLIRMAGFKKKGENN